MSTFEIIVKATSFSAQLCMKGSKAVFKESTSGFIEVKYSKIEITVCAANRII